ncbi:MAG: hypothetical protein HQL73_09090, partial [Magnetococcales bacterium]|nr:hypothetical protein [Magnetococcales bacterium]
FQYLLYISVHYQWFAQINECNKVELFSLNQTLPGLDLTYKTGPDTLLTNIFEEAKRTKPSLFTPEDTLKKLYFNPNDASFNRALGNAALSLPDFPWSRDVNKGGY